MDAFVVIATLLGALGVFLYGMKVMSEGLQKVAGRKLKELLGRMTGNRFSGVLTGFGVTTVVQSSSATTVMVVGFVNAKLLSLKQAIGVIMGANIGTTITGWLVALLGFKVKVASFALPAIGIGVALTFLKNTRRRQIGEVLLGFGLLFLGLNLMKDAVPDLDQSQLGWVAQMSDMGFLSLLLFVGIGTLLTIVLQSSSATMTLTLTLVASGAIGYDMAAAMVLGENIGTTITANLAAIGTSTTARRAARAHFVFNIIGVLWCLPLLTLAILPLVDQLVPGNPLMSVGTLEGKGVVTAHLAAFHTFFNIVNTSLMLPFVDRIARFVTRLTPEKEGERGVAKYVSAALVQTPELLVQQVHLELQHMTEVVREMYGDALSVLSDPDKDLSILLTRTMERERFVEQLEAEISRVLTLVAQSTTSEDTAASIGDLALDAHRLERIAMRCGKLVRIAADNASRPAATKMPPSAVEDTMALGKEIDRILEMLSDVLVGEASVEELMALDARIDARRQALKQSYAKRMSGDEEAVLAGMMFLDVLSHYEEIGDGAMVIARRSPALAG